MRYRGVTYVGLVFLVFVLSCSSLNKKAQQYFDAGAYEEALATFDEVLEKDPDDTDATIGRMKSREKLVDTKLIEVRHSRIAGNEQNSIEMLLKLVLLENTWSFYPKGPVAFTQEEESREALAYIRKISNKSLKNQLPLQAQIQLLKYKPVFQGSLLPEFEKVSDQVKSAGVKSCQGFLSVAQTELPYFSQFVQKYCGYWGYQSRDVARDNTGKEKGLFGKLKLVAAIKGVPGELIATFEEEAKRAFAGTPWFDAKGTKELVVNLQGTFFRHVNQKHGTRIFEYTVSIPYTAYEPTLKTRQVPYTAYEYQCVYNAYAGSICGNEPVTRYRSELYTENEPVTRYREEPRSQPYDGVEVYQLIALFLKGQMKFNKTSEQFQISEKSEDKSFQHDWNMPDIGLYPQKLDLPDPMEWIKARAVEVGEKIEETAFNVWEQYYCMASLQKKGVAISGDQVHRCLRRKPSETPRFISSWYQNNLGVSLDQAEETLGLKDY